MNYKILKESILKPCSVLTKKKGEELYNKKSVKQIQGKKIQTIFHIYGKVEDGNRDVNTHIKYNIETEKVASIRCTCEKYSSYKEEGYNYYCEHIAATSYSFLATLLKNINNKKTVNDKDNNKKINLALETKIYLKTINNINHFEIEFKIGCRTMYLIRNLKEFINGILQNKDVVIADTFTYSPKLYCIEKKDRQLLEFIRNNYKNALNTTSKIKLTANNLYMFLKELPKRDIVFKDNFLEYKSKINEKQLPLAFNLKYDLDQVFMTSEKNMPLLLDNEGRVYLYNREIYIFSAEIGKMFYPIYMKLNKNNLIYLPESNVDIINIISTLSMITSKINLTDDLKAYISKFIDAKYIVSKEQGHIYINVIFNYGNKDINILKDDRNKLDCLRSLKLEDRVIMSLEKLGFIKNDGRMVFKGNDEQLFEFLKYKSKDLISNEEVIVEDNLNEFNIIDYKSLNGVLYEEDWAIKIAFGINSVDNSELKSIFYAYKDNKRFYKTNQYNYIDLTDLAIINFLNVIDLLNIENDLDKGMAYIKKSKATLLEHLIKKDGLDFLENKTGIETISNKMDALNENKLKLDTILEGVLRPYQYEGVTWINNLYTLDLGGILADEMGLGKTLQTIAFLSMRENKKSLIVTPTSLIYNWIDEFNKFAPQIKVGTVYGNNEKRRIVIKSYEEYDVLITTYGIVKSDLEYFKNIDFDICIIDEAQNIKNPDSQNAKAVKDIKARWSLALTGTPIENNLIELWSIFDFIMPGFLYSKRDFESKFNKNDAKSLWFLKNVVSPFILRRTKNEVAKELPSKVENKIMVSLSDGQRMVYNSFIKEVANNIKSKNNIEVFSYLTKLRQICLHPALIMDEYEGDSGKFKVAHSYIHKQLKKNGKTLIFSQFTSLIDLFSEELDNKNIKYYTLNGSTPSKERRRLVNDFNENDDVKVFLISLKAGGTGLNLTAANLVIHFDPWWNPAVESQASDRAHRIGQKKEVEVIKLIAKNTIEEKILLLQEDKKELIDNILSGDNINNAKIDRKIIEELVDAYSEI